MPFNAHFTAAHRVTADDSLLGNDFAAARQPEILPEMRFLRRARRKQFHSFSNFHQAFLALALFAARGGNFDPERFRAIEKRKACREVVFVRIEV
jgi:hypothetical protein